MSDQPFPPPHAQDQGPYPQADHPGPTGRGHPPPGGAPGAYGPGPGGPPGRPPGAHGPGPGGPDGPGGPAPRRRSGALVVVLIVVVALVLGGAAFVVASGGDDDDEPDVRNDLTLADLDPALLAAADLPETFTEVTWEADPGDELTPDDIDDIDASEECTQALRRFAVNDGDDREIGSEFDSVDGATITHTLSLVQADDPPIGDVRAAVGSCGTFGYDDGEHAGQITLEATSVEGIGDDALGLGTLVETESQGTPVSVEMYGILVDRDGVRSAVRATGALPLDYRPGDPIVSDRADRDMVRQAAEAIDAKVEGVVAG